MLRDCILDIGMVGPTGIVPSKEAGLGKSPGNMSNDWFFLKTKARSAWKMKFTKYGLKKKSQPSKNRLFIAEVAQTKQFCLRRSNCCFLLYSQEKKNFFFVRCWISHSLLPLCNPCPSWQPLSGLLQTPSTHPRHGRIWTAAALYNIPLFAVFL